MFRRLGLVLGIGAFALISFAMTASADSAKQKPLEPPPGSVLLARGAVYGQPWVSYAMKQGGSACVFIHARGTYFSCGAPASWVPPESILLAPTGGYGPPWVLQGFVLVRPRVIGIKATLECGQTFTLHPRKLAKKERRKTSLPRQVLVVPFVYEGQDYVVSATAYGPHGSRIGTSTFEPPPRDLRGLPPC